MRPDEAIGLALYSLHKFEVARGQELLVQVPLPIAEVWAEMQAQVEELTGQAGLQILRAILEKEMTSVEVPRRLFRNKNGRRGRP